MEHRTHPVLIAFIALCINASLGAGKEREVPAEEFLAGEAVRIDIPTDTGSVLKGVYPIDGMGMADLPVAGRIVVAGKNRPNVEKYLADIWAPYLKDTHVTARPVIRVTVVGNVKTPGNYYPPPDAVIYDVITLAGGPLLPYKLGDIAHLRAGENIGGLAEPITRGLTLREAGIRSGDEILVPIADRITWAQAIPLIGTVLAIVLNALTIYYLTADRINK